MRRLTSDLPRESGFLRLWLGQSVSLLGTQITLLALPLTAVLVLKASPAEMGILAGMEGIASFLVGFFGGALADRVRRRPLLIATDLGSALCLASVPLVWWLGKLTLPYLYVVSFLVGALTIVFYVSYQSYLPTLVAPARLVTANSRLQTSNALAQVGGPGIAGALIGAMAAPLVLLLDCLSYLISALLVWSIAEREPSPERRQRSIWGEIGEGIRWVVHEGVLRTLLLSSSVFNFCGGIFSALLILYLSRTVHLTAAGIGLVESIGSAGSVAGALLASRITRRVGLGPTITVAVALVGIGWAMAPLASGPRALTAALIAGGLALAQFWIVIYTINVVSLRQRVTPQHIAGRVNASMISVMVAAAPLGSLSGGYLAGSTGIRPILLGGALFVLATAPWLAFSPVQRLAHGDTE